MSNTPFSDTQMRWLLDVIQQHPAPIDGIDGPQGATGPTGPTGDTGAAGIDGRSGPSGPSGPKGPKGERGDDGIDGRAGTPGRDGAVGPKGAAGPRGPKGDTGETGPTGPAGKNGSPGGGGMQGIKGDTGATGPSGSGGGGLAIYGDGHQGDITYSVDTQLNESVYADSITIDAGVTLDVNDWPIYARGTLINNGTIHNDGVDAGPGTSPGLKFNNYASLVPGGGGGAVGDLAGSDGVGGSGSYRASTTGNGGGGGNTDGHSGGITDVDPWWNMQRSVLGGGSIVTNADVSGGGPTNNTIQIRAPWAGGSGGGSGAAQGAYAGGGGQGAGVVLLACRHIVNNGTIRAIGGVGGDASDASAEFATWASETVETAVIQPSAHVYRPTMSLPTGTVEPTWPDDGSDVADGDEIWQDIGEPAAGGGGGGQGGNVFAICDDYIGNEPDVTGGSGGAGFGDGTAGLAGDDGHAIHLSNT